VLLDWNSPVQKERDMGTTVLRCVGDEAGACFVENSIKGVGGGTRRWREIADRFAEVLERVAGARQSCFEPLARRRMFGQGAAIRTDQVTASMAVAILENEFADELASRELIILAPGLDRRLRSLSKKYVQRKGLPGCGTKAQGADR
jgi:hypothetical protein